MVVEKKNNNIKDPMEALLRSTEDDTRPKKGKFISQDRVFEEVRILLGGRHPTEKNPIQLHF